MLDPSILIGTGQPGVTIGPSGSPAADLESLGRRVESAETSARVLASLVEIQSQIDGARDLSDGAAIAARLLADALPASQVWVTWRDDGGRCRLLADRGDQPNHDQTRLIESAAEESAFRGGLTLWPSTGNKNRHALMAVEQFAHSVSASALVAAPLIDGRGNNRGAIIGVSLDGPLGPTAAALLDAVVQPLATKLDAIARMEPGRLESLIRGAAGSLSGDRKKWAILTMVVLIAVLLIPLKYRIGGSFELQPVQRRFIAAPFDGPLQKSLVRPGDLVSEGDLLATFNPREIDYELAGVRADLSRADQEKKGLIAEHDFAGSKIAALETERLRLQTQLLEYRRENLEIRSPLAGVVVSGDWKQSEGAPLSRGETMFEIAPLGEFVVEIALDERDFAHAGKGMPVRFYVHSLPERRFNGTIERIHPRAELRDHDNVFIAEVKISDPENVLRPGMRGRASIYGDRHPLGWNLFHKAYHSLRSALAW